MPINAMKDPSSMYEAVSAANTITAAESGKTFGHSSAAAIIHTLPTAAAGLEYKFVIKTAPTASSTIVTAGSANIMNGQIVCSNDGAAVTTAASSDTITLTSNAIVGDWVSVKCNDGTNWEVEGMTDAANAFTTSQAS